MVDLVEIQAAYYMVAATGVLVAAIYYIYNIRINQRAVKATLETRQTQLFMQVMDKMDQRWLDDLFEILNEWEWKDFDDFDKKYHPTVNPDSSVKRMATWLTYEAIGLQYRTGLLDMNQINAVGGRGSSNLGYGSSPSSKSIGNLITTRMRSRIGSIWLKTWRGSGSRGIPHGRVRGTSSLGSLTGRSTSDLTP